MKRVKREHVIPGTLLAVRSGKTLTLDAHLYLSGVSRELPDGTSLIVVTGPRKKDNINLVRVRINECDEYECFYCDVLTQCEVA